MNKLFKFAQVKGKWHKFPSFNLGGGAKLYKNFAQKLLAVSLCMAMVLLGVPRGQNFVAEAAADPAIPNTLFLTKEALLALCEDTNDGTGLLAAGTGTDVKLRINFGTRPEEVLYYGTGYEKESATAGDLTWLVAGSDSDDSVVLYSEEPLVSANNLKYHPTGIPSSVGPDSRFQSSAFLIDLEGSDVLYSAEISGLVYPNHWGVSLLRNTLQQLFDLSESFGSSRYFMPLEVSLVVPSSISTRDYKVRDGLDTPLTFTTLDFLYSPSSPIDAFGSDAVQISVGFDDSLRINRAYWGGLHWLRSPRRSSNANSLVAVPLDRVSDSSAVDDPYPAVSAAFRLDLSSVLFTSAASAGTGFSALDPNTPMTLRLDGTGQDLGTAEVSVNTVSVADANGSTLMVQGVTGDGQNWSYSKAIDSDNLTTVTAAQVAAAGSIALSSFDNCEVWLEKPVESGGTLTYAVRAVTSVTGVSLSDTSKSLTLGETFDLTATVSPEDATNKNVTWTSSDTSVATVDENGTVKALKVGTTTITVTTVDGAKTATCEVTVTEAAGDTPPPATTPDSTPDTTPAAPPAATPADSSYLETTVTVKGKTQRLRVYDPNGVLPKGTTLSAEAVTSHEHIDDDHEIEHLLAYDLSLLDASGHPLHMPLDAPVELCFEVLDGLDKDELEVVLVQEFDDAEFEETLANLDGASWVKVKTNHFSPYALIDKLSPEEKGVQVQADPGPKNNVTTGDQGVQVAVAGLGMVLVLSLGIMLRLITSKKKFEE